MGTTEDKKDDVKEIRITTKRRLQHEVNKASNEKMSGLDRPTIDIKDDDQRESCHKRPSTLIPPSMSSLMMIIVSGHEYKDEVT